MKKCNKTKFKLKEVFKYEDTEKRKAAIEKIVINTISISALEEPANNILSDSKSF